MRIFIRNEGAISARWEAEDKCRLIDDINISINISKVITIYPIVYSSGIICGCSSIILAVVSGIITVFVVV